MNTFVNYVVRNDKDEAKTVNSLTSALATGRFVKAVLRTPLLDCSSPDELIGVMLVLCRKSEFILMKSIDAGENFSKCSEHAMNIDEAVKFVYGLLGSYRYAYVSRNKQGKMSFCVDVAGDVEYTLTEV